MRRDGGFLIDVLRAINPYPRITERVHALYAFRDTRLEPLPQPTLGARIAAYFLPIGSGRGGLGAAIAVIYLAVAAVGLGTAEAQKAAQAQAAEAAAAANVAAEAKAAAPAAPPPQT